MSNPRHVVFGPTGEIGRWLVAELTGAGDQVAVIMRNAGARRDTFAAWIAAHGGNARQLVFIEGDVTRDRLGIDELGRKQIADARLIYNLSARYAWGLSKRRPPRSMCAGQSGSSNSQQRSPRGRASFTRPAISWHPNYGSNSWVCAGTRRRRSSNGRVSSRPWSL